MENNSSKSVYCCFCDKDLSTSDQSSGSREIKYKCPACEKFYCNSNCFTGHKDKLDCPGVRDKTPYIHLSKFDQKQFLDDYFFLEEVNNKIETSQRILSQLRKDPSKKTVIKKKKYRSKSRKQNKSKQTVDQPQQQP